MKVHVASAWFNDSDCLEKLHDKTAEQLEEDNITIQKYEIPKEILSKFSDDFWKALTNELARVFGNDIFDKDEDAGTRQIVFLTSTIGWAKAFMKTCRDFKLIDILEYYDKLEWYDSDAFDDMICKILEEKYIKSMEETK